MTARSKNDFDWFPMSCDYPQHDKILHLCEILENDLADAYPVRLMCWLRNHENVSGDFRSDVAVEQVARWRGERGELVKALRKSRILNGLTYHGWVEKGGRLVAKMIADRLRKATELPRNFHGTSGHLPAQPSISTSPSISPSTSEKERSVRKTMEDEDPVGFAAFWDAWPKHHRKADRSGCAVKWRSIPSSLHSTIMSRLAAWKLSGEWLKDNGGFIPAPKVWLNQKRWEAEAPPEPFHTADVPRDRAGRRMDDLYRNVVDDPDFDYPDLTEGKK